MQVLVVFVAVACFAQAALGWAPYHGEYAHGGYHGPLAKPVVLKDGFLADTPEVAAAKAAHLKLAHHVAAGPAEGYAGAGYAAGYAGKYHGPLAKPVVLPSGFLADTPEVAAAKHAHFKLAHHDGYAGAYAGAYDDGSYKGEGAYDDGSYKGEGSYAAPAPAWTGAYAGAYDDGSYKGEGAYAAYAPVAHGEDDGSYKPHLYEHGHY